MRIAGCQFPVEYFRMKHAQCFHLIIDGLEKEEKHDILNYYYYHSPKLMCMMTLTPTSFTNIHSRFRVFVIYFLNDF